MKDDHDQFLKARKQRLQSVEGNSELIDSAQAFLKQCHHDDYSYNFDWMGLPVIQYPQDLLVMQEIIWRVKPDLIIEMGIARGGSLVFYASMLELLGSEGRVLGIDVDIREHNKRRVLDHPMSKRIEMIEGSSLDSDTHRRVKEIAHQHQTIMVCLDSNHTHEHVLNELRLYAPLVSSGSYCVVFDTIVELMPDNHYQNRPWNKGNSPATAVLSYLEECKDFKVDVEVDCKLLISAALGGYLYKK